MKDLDVVVCGLVVADVIGRPIDLTRPPTRGSLRLLPEIKLFTGGNVCNSGIALAKLGMRVGAIGRVGNDGWKEFLLAELQRHGIDCRAVRVEPKVQTSATMVCVDGSGERTFFHVLGANTKLSTADLLENQALLSRAKVLIIGYYGMLPALEPRLPQTLAAIKRSTRSPKRPYGIAIALDTGGSTLNRPRLPHLGKCLRYVDYFIPSRAEATALTGETAPTKILDALQSASESSPPKVLGVKLGARGCVLREAHGDHQHEYRIPALRVEKVVDTTGAGDSFLAGFIAATLRGFSPAEAGLFGNAVGACCIQALGATAGVQSFVKTLRMLRR